jgi:CheY-like chemotaxis protein
MTYSALVVDDNDLNRDLIQIALNTAGFEVSAAKNGREAIAALDAQAYNLMVLDLQMPMMDGTSVLKWLRANPLHNNMIVIVATANAHMVGGDEGERADYVIYKPLDMREFVHLLKRLKDTF